MHFVFKKCRWLFAGPPGIASIQPYTLSVFKWTTILLLACLCTSAGNAQKVTLRLNKGSLVDALKAIQKQTGYSYFIKTEQVKKGKPVTVNIADATLQTALDKCFEAQPLTYTIIDKAIMVKDRLQPTSDQPATQSGTLPVRTIRGMVTDSVGNPLAGVNVTERNRQRGTTTAVNGSFTITNPQSDELILSLVGFAEKEVKIGEGSYLAITLQASESKLDNVVVRAYGTTSQRLNTGSIGRVTAEEIQKQPVSNPLAALAGRVPGLVVTQSSGLPGSTFRIQIRGRNSIAQGNDPMFVVDGVPFAPNGNRITGNPATFDLGNGISGGLSPFNTLNPNDIESIEILRDADATAIYGSRGANGVVLITTKKGAIGKTKVDLSLYTGFSKVPRMVKMMNTQQYVEMRKEAFKNDGVTMTNANAYDILVWDTTRYTDWQKELIGGTARTSDGQLTVSGGNRNTQYRIGGNYHKETNVFPGHFADTRGGLQFAINNSSIAERLNISLSGSYSAEENNLPTADLSTYNTLIPNLPVLFDSSGNLAWSKDGYPFDNPLARLRRFYTGKMNNLISNLQVRYRILSALFADVHVGYSTFQTDQTSITPYSSIDPASGLTSGNASFDNTDDKSLIIEPKVNYKGLFGSGHKLEVLIGGSYQRNTFKSTSQNGRDYASDALLGSIDGAGTKTISSNYSEYKYAAIFGQTTYNFANTYLLNLSARRDGSSRFGPGRQFANFGAVGAGWIFSNLATIKNTILSYGKLRASYGSAGNDNIGDYQYLDLYQPTTYPYQTGGIYPTKLFNANYGWEINRKLEVALELGAFNDRLLLTTTWYRNRSGNQLIQYTLPAQTGFTSITMNLPALVQNTGFEVQLQTDNIKSPNFQWSTSFNISIPRNKLLAYPGLESSSFRYSYVVGESLSIVNGFVVKQVDPETGLYTFVGANGQDIKSTPAYPDDIKMNIANLAPRYYGGLSNSFGYRSISLDIFFDFRNQIGLSYAGLNGLTSVPGTRYNLPIWMLDRWKQPGDVTEIQRVTTTASNPAYQNVLRMNTGATNRFVDASFARLKNVNLSWSMPRRLIERTAIERCDLYLQGQNLFVLTRYKGSDPETQMFIRLPPLRTLALGIRMAF
jgi:TonB-linked SusC/RagA family outer membrane protein